MDEKKLEESVNKVIEYCSAELCLSGPEMETVLNHAATEVETLNGEKYWEGD